MPAGVVALLALVASYAVTWWWVLLALVALAVGAGLAHDRWRGLGHALVDGHLVARSGSLDRRREALHTPSVIGWNLRATFFQRRVGLTDLVATTAGGRQKVRVLDLDERRAVDLAAAAHRGCSTSSWSPSSAQRERRVPVGDEQERRRRPPAPPAADSDARSRTDRAGSYR